MRRYCRYSLAGGERLLTFLSPQGRRQFFFPRGVEEAKGVFIGNFPAAAEGDSADFFNKVPFLCHDATVAEAAVFLQKYDVGCVPVLHRETKELVGMFSERDVARSVAALSFAKPVLPVAPSPNASNSPAEAKQSGATAVAAASTSPRASENDDNHRAVNYHAVKVEDLMSKNVVSIVQGTSLSEALLIMDKQNFRHLPVVSQHDAKRVVGLVSMRDIMHRHVKGEAQTTTEDFMQWVLKMSS